MDEPDPGTIVDKRGVGIIDYNSAGIGGDCSHRCQLGEGGGVSGGGLGGFQGGYCLPCNGGCADCRQRRCGSLRIPFAARAAPSKIPASKSLHRVHEVGEDGRVKHESQIMGNGQSVVKI